MKYIIWKDKKIEVKPEFLSDGKTWFGRTAGCRRSLNFNYYDVRTIQEDEVLCPEGIDGWAYDKKEKEFKPILNEIGKKEWDRKFHEMARLCSEYND
jgi:hypothetical protein